MPTLIDQFRGLGLKLKSPAILAYGITGVVAVASFLSTLILARLAGAEVIGQYALAMSTAHLLASFSVLGLDRLLIREVAGDLRVERPDRAREISVRFTRTVLLMSVLVAALYLIILFFTPLSSLIGGDMLALTLVAGSILVWPLQRFARAGLRAVGFPLKSQIIESFATVFFLIAASIAAAFSLSVSAAMAVGTMILGHLIAGIWAWRLFRPIMSSWPRPEVQIDRALVWAGLPQMGNLFLQLFADWFVLASVLTYASAAEAGAFRVAIQFVGILVTLISTTEIYIAARFAGHFRAGRLDLFWGQHRRSTYLMTAVSAPIVAIFILFPEPLLRVAFGPEFVIAAPALAILAGGQMVVALRGPISVMLSMSGHDNVQFILTLFSLPLLIVLAYVLIPLYGLAGAALAQLGPILLRATVGYFLARQLIPK